MNSRLYIPALITLGLGILSGCGGSSSSEQAYLPTGLQRTLDITLQDGKPYVFSFIIASESTATFTPEPARPPQRHPFMSSTTSLPPTLRNR